jgi:DNA repair exonuclease SbcCD ATPase subunit
MKIKNMTAYFGALEGQSLQLGEGLNILYAPNERGKSTWCAFVRAMLYGISTSQRAKAGQKPDKVKYRPWSGTPMSGTMDLVSDTYGPVTIRRWTEKANQPMQAFSATVTGTDTPVPGLTADTVGQALTGVPREVFERSAFIRQAGLEITSDPELDRRINAIVSTGDEQVSYLETEKLLKTWLRHRRSGKRGAIPELEEQIEKDKAALQDIRQASASIPAMEEQIQALTAQQEALAQQIQQARAQQRRQALSDMSQARAQVQQAEKACQQAEKALAQAQGALDETPYGDMGVEEAARRSRQDRETVQELERLADKLPPVKLAYIPLALGALAFLLALVLPWKVPLAGAGCILALLFVVMFTRLQSLRKTKEDTLADRQRILDAYGVAQPEEIEELLSRYRTLWKEKERAELLLEQQTQALQQARQVQKTTETQTVSDLDFVSGDSPAARLGRQQERTRAQLAACKEQRAQALGRVQTLGDPVALESAVNQKTGQLEALLAQEQALELALEAMAAADSQLQSRFSPQLAKKAAQIFAQLTDGRYDEVTLARDLTAKARRTGDAVGWETDYLSAGARDGLYLALRLAVCDLALPGDDPCPLVLDDAFVTFDEARMEKALELCRELAKKRQILLFTCHEREYNDCKHDRTVNTVML